MNLKNLALLSIVLAGNVYAQRSPFENGYFGLDLGYVQNQISFSNEKRIVVGPILSQAQAGRLTGAALSGGLTLGYHTLFCNPFLLGFEARANFEDLNSTFSTVDVETNADVVINSSCSVKLNQDYSLLGKLGLIQNETALLYALAGINWGHIALSTFANYDQNNLYSNVTGHQTTNELGLALGLGIEYSIYCRMSIGLEYLYTDYGNLKYPNDIRNIITNSGVPIANAYLSDASTFKMYLNRTLLHVKYYF